MCGTHPSPNVQPAISREALYPVFELSDPATYICPFFHQGLSFDCDMIVAVPREISPAYHVLLRKVAQIRIDGLQRRAEIGMPDPDGISQFLTDDHGELGSHQTKASKSLQYIRRVEAQTKAALFVEDEPVQDGRLPD
jgi:hypothetical protein